MTDAPTDLLQCRRYLLDHTGLAGDSIGIVAGPEDAQTGGYHCGNDQLRKLGRLDTDYSKRESPLDRPGTDAASALDIGSFSRLRELSAALVRDAAVDPRLNAIREIIYSVDGQTVKRWDRLGIRFGGDNSHRYHTHISFFRQSQGSRNDERNFFGWLREFFEGEPMAEDTPNALIAEWRIDAIFHNKDKVTGGSQVDEVNQVKRQLDLLKVGIAGLENQLELIAEAVNAIPPREMQPMFDRAIENNVENIAAALARHIRVS